MKFHHFSYLPQWLLPIFIFLLLQPDLIAQKKGIEQLDSMLLHNQIQDSTRLNLLKEALSLTIYSNPQKALLYADEYLSLGKILDNQKAIISGLTNKGVINCMSGNWSKGLDFFFNAIEYIEKIDDKKLLAMTYSNIAGVYMQTKDIKLSLQYNEEALKLAKELDNKRLIADIRHAMAIGYMYLAKDVEEKERINLQQNALKNYQESLSTYRALNLKNRELDCLTNIGILNFKMGYYSLSLGSFDEALIINKDVDDKTAYSTAYTHRGMIYIKSGNFIEAEKNLLAAYKIAKDNKLEASETDILEKLTNLAVLNNDYPTYEKYNKELSAHRDSLYNKEKIQALHEAKEKFETEKKEALNKKLQQQNELLTNKNNIFLAFILSLAVLLVIGYIGFIKVRKQNKIIELQAIKLKKLNETKDRFFSIIAHDLRSPLAGLNDLTKKIAYLIRHERFDDLQRMGERVENNSAQVSKLLDNLLTWALVQKDNFPYHPEKIDLTTILEEQLRLLQYQLEASGVNLSIEQINDMSIHADRNAVSTIFRNLLDNAIKFTPVNKKITISASIKNEMANISIKDEGIGIYEEDLKHLFSIKGFQKINHNIIDNKKGTGLGLVLCKELIKLNKGEIAVSSTKNEGSCFLVKLPL